MEDISTQSGWYQERQNFPAGLFAELDNLGGGMKWSLDQVNMLLVDSVVAIMPFLRSRSDLVVEDDGEYDEWRGRVTIKVNGQNFIIRGRKEIAAANLPDVAFLPNLEVIKTYLDNPEARVLYLGSNTDQSAKEVFGKNAVNMDIQGDVLGPGDVRADATKSPFRDETFDVVVMKNSNDIIRDAELIKELHRILKNGGILFYAAGTHSDYQRGVNVEIDAERSFLRDDIEKVYIEDGTNRFERIEIPGMRFAEDMVLLKVVK